MRNFFARQEDARRWTARLLVLFGLAVLGVSVAVYLVAAVAAIWVSGAETTSLMWRPQLFFWTTGCTLLVVSLGSLWKISQLREGGARVASMLGGRPVSPATKDQLELRLRNVVEEMAIASGVPVPDLYLLEQERGINAFAAGNDIKDAVICVTRGAVELLNRDELQAVVAHEFSHILNGDMSLNLSLIGWLNGILLISQAGETAFRGLRRAGGRNAGAVILIAGALYIIGYIGYFFGRLIKSGVSRQREYLGDASAVQFTRNPSGLAGALKKIGGLSAGSRLAHPRAPELSHLFFSNGLEEAWFKALDSHPPLDERIRRIEPRFDGRYPEVKPLPAPPPPEIYTKAQTSEPSEQIVSLSGAAVAALLEGIGQPVQEHLDLAGKLLSQAGDPLISATREAGSARALIYSLLLDSDPVVRVKQEEILAEREGSDLLRTVRDIASLGTIAPELRLPLLDLSMPALRTMNPDQFLCTKGTVDLLSAADRRTSLFEFTLRYLLLRNLEPRFTSRPHRPAQIYGLRGVQKECCLVLSALARVGHREEGQAQFAFERGACVLYEPKAELSFAPAADCGISQLELSLQKLEGASALIKRRLLAACLECLVHDQKVSVGEIELFRAVADAIGCPVPPWLNSAPAMRESLSQPEVGSVSATPAFHQGQQP